MYFRCSIPIFSHSKLPEYGKFFFSAVSDYPYDRHSRIEPSMGFWLYRSSWTVYTNPSRYPSEFAEHNVFSVASA